MTSTIYSVGNEAGQYKIKSPKGSQRAAPRIRCREIKCSERGIIQEKGPEIFINGINDLISQQISSTSLRARCCTMCTENYGNTTQIIGIRVCVRCGAMSPSLWNAFTNMTAMTLNPAPCGKAGRMACATPSKQDSWRQHSNAYPGLHALVSCPTALLPPVRQRTAHTFSFHLVTLPHRVRIPSEAFLGKEGLLFSLSHSQEQDIASSSTSTT
jgi:hypothetical protein